MKGAYSADVELVGGSGGIFDVEVDGTMLFSKGTVGRFPEPGELLTLLERRGRA
ncbi:MAG: Rdx family protein [Desulfofustis sp. PB-SRB1]|nr:Rdx family protein [Desulfofustis sp. PB-SRB1]MBM1002489.1 Rdx family protein [Desulfofustis sp. PB-SRB1]HBH28043.1 hypothetical protein [Desulfofustis sp.]HBH30436.1 hypothetical protein [Desulfofustis sp.]